MKILFAFAALCFATAARAETAPRLNQGDWILGGAASLQFVSSGPSYFSMSPEVEYFVVNKVAVGLAASGAVVGSQNSFFFSPEITLHTKAGDTVVPYLTIKPYELGTGSGFGTYYTSAGRIGVKFFLTDSVSFGPAFEGRHYWPRNGGASSNTGTLYGVFSLHL